LVPKHVRVVTELPRTDNGKVDRRRLAQEFAQLCAVSWRSKTRSRTGPSPDTIDAMLGMVRHRGPEALDGTWMIR